MQIIQTIWTALTTENELLTKIILIPEGFLENFINMLLFITLLNLQINKKQKIRYVLTFSIISNVFNVFIPNPYKSFLNLISLILCIHYFLKCNILKSILAMVIQISLAVLCESILMKLCFSHLDAASVTAIPLYRLFITLCVQLLVFSVYLVIKYCKVQISIFENMSKKNKTIILVNFVFAIIAIIIQFLITGFYLSRLPIYIVLFSNLSLIIYFLLSIYTITKITQLEITTLNLEQEKEHNRILKLMQDDLRGFRHDFSNIMCTIGGYVQVKDIDGLSKYYSEIQKDINKVNNLGVLNPDSINNPAVFALLSSKYDEALELGIDMNINVFLDLNNLNMQIYEFTRILGILLDNAIEAAKECEEKIINIEIRKETKRNRQILLVENTYFNKNVDTEKIYEKNYSTKPNNSGLGLWEVDKILKRSKNLNLYTTKDSIFFTQQLELYDN